MSFRTLILGSLLLVLGCSGAEDGADGAVADAAADPHESLAFVTPSTSLLPSRELQLSVTYRDATGALQPGVTVDFSLVGAASGASLSPTKALTDANGVATTTLRAGSMPSDLQLRARASADAYAYLTISVRAALGTSLSVGVAYAGAREIATYTVTLVPNMTCAQLGAGLAGELTYHFSAPDEQARFDLGYGLSAALLGWGKDDTGGNLARACMDFTAPVTEDANAAKRVVTLQLADIDLSLNAALDVQLEINAASATRSFAEASTRAVAAVLSPSAAYSMFADADYLLDAVQNTLTAQGNAQSAGGLAERRSGEALAASLQPALAMEGVGPTAYGEAVGQQLAARGVSLLARWTLGSGSLSALSAQSVDGSQTLSFSTLPQASIVTRFTAATAALELDPLRIELGLGSYGQALLAGLAADTRAATTGCAGALARWWTRNGLADLVAVADVEAACVAAYGQLDKAIESELALLDADAAALQVTGAVPAHARGDDGAIDDVGPGELAGSWGSSALQAALQSPQRTAFE